MRVSRVMAARLLSKLERELGREPDEWVIELAETPIYLDQYPERLPHLG